MSDEAILWLWVLVGVAIIYAELEHAAAAKKSAQLADLSISLVQLELRQRGENGERIFTDPKSADTEGGGSDA